MVAQGEEGGELEVLTCELCHEAIDDKDDYIEVACSRVTDGCRLTHGHVKCTQDHLLRALHTCSSRANQKRKNAIEHRPHQEIKGVVCWRGLGTDSQCKHKIESGEFCKARSLVVKRQKQIAEHAAESAKEQAGLRPPAKKKKKPGGISPPQGPASGGVVPVGQKRDVQLKPLAAKENRLGVSAKPAQQAVPNGKAKNLVLCRFMAEGSIGQCPVIDCGFAHSLAEIEENEHKLREKVQLRKAIKASKKSASRGPRFDIYEDIFDELMSMAASHRSASVAGSDWEQSVGSPRAAHNWMAANGGAGNEEVEWNVVGVKKPHQAAAAGCSTSPRSVSASGSTAGRPSCSAAEPPDAAVLSEAAMHELIKFKLNACAARLTQMGFTWSDAEAAARAAGALEQIAAELMLSGSDQHGPNREVDVSEEVAKALLLMESPTCASKAQVERAIISARGNISAATEELQALMSGSTAAPPSAASGPPSPPALVTAPSSSAPSTPHAATPSAACSAQPSQAQPDAPPDKDLWAPKWEDTDARADSPPPAAAAPAPLTPAPLQPALPAHVRAAAESPPQHGQQQQQEQQQMPVEEMLALSHSPPLPQSPPPPRGSGWPPHALAAAEGAAAVDALSAGLNGVTVSSGPSVQASAPASAGPAGGAPATMATGRAPGPAPTQQPDEFDDLLDMLMAN